MRDVLLTAFVFGLVPLILVRPHRGVLAWTWLGIMNPHRLTWNFAYAMPFAQVIAVTTLVSFFFSKEPKRLPLTPVTVLLLMFVIWMTITSLFALNPHSVWESWQKVIKIQLMIFVTLMLMHTRERLHSLIWVVVLSLGFYGVKGGLFTVAGGGHNMVLGPAGSFIEGNTEIGLALIMVVPLMRYLYLNSDDRRVRWALNVGMWLTAIAIVGSQSRGAFLGGAAMAFFLWLKSGSKVITGLLLVIAITLILSIMPEAWFAKMSTIKTYTQDSSAMGRVNAWYFAWNLALARPIVGGGFKAFFPDLFKIYAPQPENFHDSHSIYFGVLGEHGFVGLGLFLSLLLSAWFLGSRIVRQTRGRPELKWAYDLASMIQVSWVGYAVGGAFLGLAYYDLIYVLIASLVLLQSIVQSSSAGIAASAAASARPFVRRMVHPAKRPL